MLFTSDSSSADPSKTGGPAAADQGVPDLAVSDRPDPDVDEIVVRVPAKVNLHLGVGPVGPDGYHPVVTVLQAVSLYDEVRVRRATESSVHIVGEGGGSIGGGYVGGGVGTVPTDQTNLALRAARLLAARTGAGPSDGVRIELRKAIPVAAGMAGGSADAAGALVACDALWQTRLGREDMFELAAGLGSDVPFALVGGTALGTGRGEQLTPVLARGIYHWVFALAEGGLSTPAVYAEYDRMLEELPQDPDLLRPAATVRPDGVLAALRAGDPVALGAAMSNDLQLPALRLRPALRAVLATGTEAGALGALVSGSGPTCAFLVESAAAATTVAAALDGSGLCRAVRAATGPAPGASIVPGGGATPAEPDR